MNICIMSFLSERDPKSHAMRSKLLSLYLVLTVLNSHMPLFVDPTAIIYSSSSNEATTFIQAINQYLCLCLSRNAVSPVPQVFEISVEIFWRVLSGMRTKLKVCCILVVINLYSLFCLERDRSTSPRNLHSHPWNENLNTQAEGHHPRHVLQTVSRSPSFSRNIP